MNKINASYCNSIKALLKKSVNVDETYKKDIVVIYDEFFFRYLDSLIQVLNEMILNITYIFIPDSYQQIIQNNSKFHNNGEIELPSGVNMAIGESNVVLNFLSGSSLSSKVRGAVLNQILGNDCKVIHCPHISDEILEIVSLTDFDKVHSDCELLAWAFGNSSQAKLITTMPSGKHEELNLRLGGWGNDPFISGGIIFENSWGNIPPGEAFWCPRKSTDINGTICIDGSIPGYRFKKGEYILLNFDRGQLINWETSRGLEVSNYLDNLKNEAFKLGDKHWDKFAELGIGLNWAIKNLTGNSLFDEKMGGTIHIALGDNIVFGHSIQSHIHEDLVIKNPTLILDNKTIIDKGKVNFIYLKKWRKEFKPPSRIIPEDCTISFNTGKIGFKDGQIKRKLNKGKRISYIDIIGNENIQAYNIFKYLPDEEISYSLFKKKSRNILNPNEIIILLELLAHYGMATINSNI